MYEVDSPVRRDDITTVPEPAATVAHNATIEPVITEFESVTSTPTNEIASMNGVMNAMSLWTHEFSVGDTVSAEYDCNKPWMMGTIVAAEPGVEMYTVTFEDGDTVKQIVNLKQFARRRRRVKNKKWDPMDAANMPQWASKGSK